MGDLREVKMPTELTGAPPEHSPEQITYSNFQLSSSEGGAMHGHLWQPESDREAPRGVAIVFHGFGAHGSYPTVRYAAEVLAAAGYVVVAADMRGHGKSSGEAGFVASADQLISDAVDLATYA